MPGPEHQIQQTVTQIGRHINSGNGYGKWSARLEDGAPVSLSDKQRGKKKLLTMVAVQLQSDVTVLQVENTDFLVAVGEDNDIFLAKYDIDKLTAKQISSFNNYMKLHAVTPSLDTFTISILKITIWYKLQVSYRGPPRKKHGLSLVVAPSDTVTLIFFFVIITISCIRICAKCHLM